ncbi:hypothetical protein CPter91_1020 [Collimonas pratensis]|uniref:Uncharacterized protein n=1 Tax=Collimonas pratensis TaxID=279113 RepID=A0A127Q077_9BURK|nr:hypothetical protein CPter91_1020 [Collimonas pratensis]
MVAMLEVIAPAGKPVLVIWAVLAVGGLGLDGVQERRQAWGG